MPRTAIVIPCFNEAARFQGDHLAAFVQEHDVRFVLVDDGSTDGTRAALASLAATKPDAFRVLTLDKNRGKAEAVRAGVLAARDLQPDYCGYWDADLATPLEAIPEFEAVLDGNPSVQLVMGARLQLLGRSIKRSAMRHYIGRVFATAASRLLCLSVYDTQCGAKLFRARPALFDLFEAPWRSTWIFDVELLARLSVSGEARAGLPTADVIHELPLRQWHDIAGSKLRPFDFVRASGQLWKLWWKYHGSCKRANRGVR